MYLRGLAEWEGLTALDRQQAEQCAAKGGTPIIRKRFVPSANALPGYMTGSEQPYFAGCQLPAAPATSGGNISVNVPTTVNTQVSPQISPQFIQQDQPQNSPVTAGATANPQQDTGGANRDALISDLIQRLTPPAAVPQASVYVPQAMPVNYETENNLPSSFPDTVNKNIVPLAVAGAALLSIVAFFRKKRG